jgi:hypothetical protein
MKINVRNKTFEIKKKHVKRAVFCGAIGVAVIYRKKYNTLSGEFDFLKLQTDAIEKFAVDCAAHALDSGIATNIAEPNKDLVLFYNYTAK